MSGGHSKEGTKPEPLASCNACPAVAGVAGGDPCTEAWLPVGRSTGLQRSVPRGIGAGKLDKRPERMG